MQKRLLKKYVFTGIKLAISIAVFIFVFLKVISENSLNLFQIITIPIILVIIITGILQLLINTYIQYNLFLIYQLRFKFAKLLVNNFISTMYLLVIPGFFAPDFYLGYVYGKQSSKYSRVISALFINRLIGLIKFVLFAVFAIIIMGPTIIYKAGVDINYVKFTHLILIGLLIIALIFICYLVFKNKILNFFSKAKEVLIETKSGYDKIIKAFLLKILFNIIGISGRVVLGILLGIHLNIIEFASIIIIINLLIALPISFNGIGIREFGYLGLLTFFGVPSNIAFSFALCEFGITLSLALMGSIIFITSNSKKYFGKIRL